MNPNPGLPSVDPPSSSPPLAASEPVLRTGWASWLARASMAILFFLAVSGLAISFAPFHPAVQWGVLAHTALGALTLLPLGCYVMRHVADYRRYAASHVTVLGWVAVIGLLVVSVSGVVLTIEALLEVRTTRLWRQIHLVSTFAMLGGVVPHSTRGRWRAHGRVARRDATNKSWKNGCRARIGMRRWTRLFWGSRK